MKLSEKDWAKVDDIVDKCGCSIEEAIQMLADDKAIDQGQRMEFDLSPEEEKAIKKAYVNSTEKTLKKPRNRKEDAVKRAFIAEIAQFMVENWEKNIKDVSIINPERIISFGFGDEKYEIIIQKKNKSKL